MATVSVGPSRRLKFGSATTQPAFSYLPIFAMLTECPTQAARAKARFGVRHPVLFHVFRDLSNNDCSILQVQAQLQLARRSSQVVDLSKRRPEIAKIAVRCAVILDVEDVERLCPELERTILSQVEVLEEREIR